MKISTILDHIDSGHMALPEFQRGYVWNRDQVRGLFDSLYRRHPVGGLLVWATESKTATHRGDGPLAAGVVKLLLDGQQRITSLYGVVRGKPPKFFDGNAQAFPGITRVSGGEFLRATDPWLSFAPDGDLFASVLAWDPAPPDHPILQYPFDSTRSAVFVARSADGGLTWDQPVKVIDEPGVRFEGPLPFLAFNDKETITADPADPNKAYLVWTRISFDPLTGFRGPTYFSRTTDGGATWEAPRPIHDPGPFAQTIANQILVLPDGTLVNVFAQGSEASRFGDVAAIRSTDGGLTWSGPAIIATAAARLVTNPDDGGPIRTGETFVEAAVDPRTGAVYVVTQALDLADGRALEGITFSQSTDGGRTWTEPVVINGTPAGLPAGDRQAFNPSVHVAANGTVAVTYYDFRNNTPAPGLPTDYWAVFADPDGRRNRPGGLANPANWGGEVRLTDGSFDMERAPSSQNENAGYFVGDYQGLTAVGNRFLAFFSVAGTEGEDTAGVYSRWFGPAGGRGRPIQPPGHDGLVGSSPTPGALRPPAERSRPAPRAEVPGAAVTAPARPRGHSSVSAGLVPMPGGLDHASDLLPIWWGVQLHEPDGRRG